MFNVLFIDEVYGVHDAGFEDFDEAVEYWNAYADTPTCVAGKMFDDETNEILWEFGKM